MIQKGRLQIVIHFASKNIKNLMNQVTTATIKITKIKNDTLDRELLNLFKDGLLIN